MSQPLMTRPAPCAAAPTFRTPIRTPIRTPLRTIRAWVLPLWLGVIGGWGACSPALAADAGSPPALAAVPAADPALYLALGADPGLNALVSDFIARLQADARTAPFFAKSDLSRLKTQLVSQLCAVSGGPCRYAGGDMKTVHSAMDIRKGDFNALVEVLQQSLSARDVPFAVQNRLLARLAPMHRDIINTGGASE